MIEKNSYSRAEVRAAGDKLPERGFVCHDCGATIPVFEDLSEKDAERVRECVRHGRDGRPAYSPDGTKLAFESNRNGNYEIYVMNLR